MMGETNPDTEPTGQFNNFSSPEQCREKIIFPV
jgi:hypothetical protein